jgi:hypothetical protein
MLESIIRIDTEQRDVLFRFLVHYSEAIATLDDSERARVGRVVLEALGPELYGRRAQYELPRSPDIHTFLIEVRDTEWVNVDGGESDDPERSADALATASRLLLDFEPRAA